MQCPYCDHAESRVLESRSTEAGKSIRRRRQCLECHHRFTTYERIESVPIFVIKQDGTKECFDPSKLLRGIIRACEKTNISQDSLEIFVEELETQLQQNPQREVSSYEIGEYVLDYLRRENEVAYIRFASVYGKFQGVKDFIELLNSLQQQAHLSPANLHPSLSYTSSIQSTLSMS
jgi:transcriptional repressor NrdR